MENSSSGTSAPLSKSTTSSQGSEGFKLNNSPAANAVPNLPLSPNGEPSLFHSTTPNPESQNPFCSFGQPSLGGNVSAKQNSFGHSKFTFSTSTGLGSHSLSPENKVFSNPVRNPFSSIKTVAFGNSNSTSTTSNSAGIFTGISLNQETNIFGKKGLSTTFSHGFVTEDVGPSQGTDKIQFHAFIENEPNSSTHQQNAFQCICFQQPYQNWSLEEHRLADYNQGRKYKNIPAKVRQPKPLFEEAIFPASSTSTSASTGTNSRTATSSGVSFTKSATEPLIGIKTEPPTETHSRLTFENPFRRAATEPNVPPGNQTSNVPSKRSVSAFLAPLEISSMFDFDPEGVPIKANHHNICLSGRVSSQSMAQASPVWQKIFVAQAIGSSTTQEADSSKLSEMHEFDFSEDDGDALWLVLNIIHLRFVKIPISLGVDALCELANLCQKYDCVHLVKPWLTGWLGLAQTKWKTTVIGKGREKWLFIAWVFGQNNLFEEVARSIVLDWSGSTSSPAVFMFGKDPHIKLQEPLPTGIQDSINAVKRETIGKLLQISNNCLSPYHGAWFARCRHRDPACDAIVYGSLLSGFERASLFRAFTPDNVQVSIQKISDAISGTKVHVYPATMTGQDHAACFSVNLKDEVGKILASIPSPVLESHVRHMEEQQKKLSGEK